MIGNLDIEKIKKNSFKLLGTLSIVSILTFNLTGCGLVNDRNDDSVYDQPIVTHSIVVGEDEVYAEVRTIGANNHSEITDDTSVSIFDVHDGFANYFSTRDLDDELVYSMPEGEYQVVSSDAVSDEFFVSSEDQSILIVINYNDNTVKIHKNYDFDNEVSNDNVNDSISHTR